MSAALQCFFDDFGTSTKPNTSRLWRDGYKERPCMNAVVRQRIHGLHERLGICEMDIDSLTLKTGNDIGQEILPHHIHAFAPFTTLTKIRGIYRGII